VRTRLREDGFESPGEVADEGRQLRGDESILYLRGVCIRFRTLSAFNGTCVDVVPYLHSGTTFARSGIYAA